MKICLDAGHCKLTPGKRSFDGSFFEYEFNLDVANRVKNHLERHEIESYVQYVNIKNSVSELNTRILAINKQTPDLVVSIHANAFGTSWNTANGWEIFCNNPLDDKAKGTILAKAIQHHSRALGLKDRGLKNANGVASIVTNTMPPAVLIEHGFYTNPEELSKLKSDRFREQCAVCDTKGILQYLGIKWKEPQKQHWGEKHLESLVQKGIINNPEAHKDSLDEPLTKAQVFALIDRIK